MFALGAASISVEPRATTRIQLPRRRLNSGTMYHCSQQTLKSRAAHVALSWL